MRLSNKNNINNKKSTFKQTHSRTHAYTQSGAIDDDADCLDSLKIQSAPLSSVDKKNYKNFFFLLKREIFPPSPLSSDLISSPPLPSHASDCACVCAWLAVPSALLLYVTHLRRYE